jgi:hypothetical protein
MIIVESVLCFYGFNYPPTVDRSELPPNDSGNMEIYDYQICDRPPVIGEVRGYPDGLLQVVEVHKYVPQQASMFEAFYVAVCTVDGSPARRNDWFDQDQQIRYVLMDGGSFVEVEPGFPESGLTTSLQSLPGEKLLFKPEGDRPVQGFDVVAIVQTQVVAVAA